MKTKDPHVCSSYGTPLTVKHILLEYRSFEKDRRDGGLSD